MSDPSLRVTRRRTFEAIRKLAAKGGVMKIDTDGFDHPRKVYDLTAALIRRGYSDSNIQAVLGGNFRRLLGDTWA